MIIEIFFCAMFYIFYLRYFNILISGNSLCAIFQDLFYAHFKKKFLG